MLKIYNAFNEHGNIKLEDHIDFIYARFDTGVNGFGHVKSGNQSCKRANYELQELKYYRDYLNSVKTIDGFVENFIIWNPFNYEMLEEKYKDIDKDIDSYKKYGLTEEGILLFTDNVLLRYPNDGSVQRIFGRYPENGMYLIMPHSIFTMSTDSFNDDNWDTYEVFQSQSLGKELQISKMTRKI